MIKQHVLIELKQFIYCVANHRNGHHHGSTKNNIVSNALVRSSLNLLESLPASREVIFEYFSIVFDVSVNSYMLAVSKDPQFNAPSSNPEEEELINDIQEALENLITKGPLAWGPLIASWSLELVGKLSNKYWPTRKIDIGGACNLWLNCCGMRCLLGLIASCFRKLNNTEAETCVETLLATFRKFSPTFDWVVARLGGCFPLKIISQILQCGLKRFCDDIRCHFDSEIGILDYLSFAHEKDLKHALRELLNDGLNPKNKYHTHIVPYLFKLSLYSDVVLQAVVGEFLTIYNEDVLDCISRNTIIWMQNSTFRDMQPTFNNILLKIKSNGSKLLVTISKLTERFLWCQDFIESTLQELEQLAFVNRICPLVEDLSKDNSRNLLWKSCTSDIFVEQQTAVRLLLLVSTQYSHIYHQTISELLAKSYEINKNGIGAMVRMLGGLSGILDFPEIKPGLEMSLENICLKLRFHSEGKHLDCKNVVKNLITLTRMEKSNSSPYLKSQPVTIALKECLLKILEIFDCILIRLITLDIHYTKANQIAEEPDMKRPKFEKMEIDEDQKIIILMKNDYAILAHMIVELLNSIDAGSKQCQLGTVEVLKLSNYSVKYFFWSLTEKSPTQRAQAVQQCFELLERNCNARKSARSICVRELIEGCLYSYGDLFGGYEDEIVDDISIPEEEKLIFVNRKQVLGTSANRSDLHAGIIGKGLKKISSTDYGEYSISRTVDPELENLFLKALDACCTDLDKPNNYDGYRLVSLLLVEMVSSDVMYNGLPFPDEEFTKITMERDLLIRRAFRSCPVLWGILGLIAARRPTLCFSSVLLRALCATFLHQWRAKNVNKLQSPQESIELLISTKKLLEVLSLGQLLPPPLSNLHIIIEHLEASEIALVLKECIWNYLKDNVPSPVQFYCDSNGLYWRNSNLLKINPIYIDTLRHIMQKKLPTLGAHYHQMFALPEMDSNNKI